MNMLNRYDPVINGLRLGELVELAGDTPFSGLHGQVQEYLPDSKQLSILVLSEGNCINVDPSCAIPAQSCKSPGDGGAADGFDVVVGPRTSRIPLGEALSDSLGRKGFCVVRTVQSAQELSKAFDALKQLDAQGEFGRLSQEVEGGYLGNGGRAKVMWLDPENSPLPTDSLILKSDGNISTMADILLPYCEDCAGQVIAERTPALVCLSMTDEDEVDYATPMATDQVVEEYYSTWCRAVFRVIHFMGPSKGQAILKLKDGSPLGNLDETYAVSASSNTILIVREDTFHYRYEEPDDGEACWLTSFFMRQAPEWSVVGQVDGDTSFFETTGAGPPPPSADAGNLVAVCAISLQACGKMTDHEKEWAAYSAGTDGQLEMPLCRFDYHPYYSDEVDMPMGTTYVKHFAVQEGIDLFDNRIFEISNMESEAMDPICRQVMEVGYLSVFKIGITKKYCNTNPIHASVSVGCDKQEWLHMPGVPQSVATNNQLAICANRFNYVFNLKGGSYVCDTACSSSLVAAHLGKTNLLERRWDPLEWHLGLGAGLTLTVGSFVHSCAAHMLSPGGRCFTFNATANGYNRGDGTACMLLKAGSCDDQRMCYFRGSQMGQDGRSASMSAPNGPAQEKCVWGAIREARMTPPESTTWECHGTGTSLGDPIEVGAVRKVQIKMKRLEPLMVASSKSNFGHLEGSAAAIAMNKCVVVVMKITCSATQHLKTLNPHLDHAAFEAIFTSEANPYKYRQGHCQVSSFGVGGTNGHAIFWGEGAKPDVDYKVMFVSKVRKAAAPIIVDGPDPADWEYSGPDYNAVPGVKYNIILNRDPFTDEETVSYERVEDEPLAVEFYCTTGSHNEWSEDRMLEGDVPGLFYQEIDVPESGTFEFRILADGDHERVIGPETTTARKLAPILGPLAGLQASWVVKAKPGSSVKLEFLAPVGGPRSIMWIPTREEE
uniref:Type I polyketide synthase n=1 Tax=Gambierdiscus polynesiensis TaxID=439318 RepID=A0A1S6K885_9DINO|nr:type I polyketide synthase [Gambierdiscus polynesiensis]